MTLHGTIRNQLSPHDTIWYHLAPPGTTLYHLCHDGPAASNILIQSGQQSFCQGPQSVVPYSIPSIEVIVAKIPVH